MPERTKRPGQSLALIAGLAVLGVLGPEFGLRSTQSELAARRPERTLQPLSAREFADLVARLVGDAEHEFFGDNVVSNERSYGDVGPLLRARAGRGGAYLGVGPEQNFTYVAWCRPELAFIVDVRRENALLHLMYKAIFSEARDRAHFLALLLGRDDDEAKGRRTWRGATFRELADSVLASPRNPRLRDELAARWLGKIENEYLVPLSASDRAALVHIQGLFFEHQLDLRFMQTEADRTATLEHPTLRELLEAEPRGGPGGAFLETDESFEFVRTMQREHRIVPVVGDFAGQRVLGRIGDELRRRRLVVSAFYVSNVEQYLFEPGRWRQWVHNVSSLPTDASSLFIRSYMDQGRPHPLTRGDQRGATVLQQVDDFVQSALRYRDLYHVATDGPLLE